MKFHAKRKAFKTVRVVLDAAPAQPVRSEKARAFAKRTHELFVVSLRKAADMDAGTHGVLAGPVAKRAR